MWPDGTPHNPVWTLMLAHTHAMTGSSSGSAVGLITGFDMENKMKNNEQKTWKPEPPFMTHAMELYQSEAFRSLSNAERKILARIEIEHMKHGGKDNGRLTCTYEDFIAYGVRDRSIPAALQHLQTVGILHVTQRGRRDAMRNPHHYRLTYLPSFNGKWPTNEWRNYHPISPPQQTKAPTTIKRKSGGIRQKPGGENARRARGENAPRSGAKTPVCAPTISGGENARTI
jgi:hypothetical protein